MAVNILLPYQSYVADFYITIWVELNMGEHTINSNTVLGWKALMDEEVGGFNGIFISWGFLYGTYNFLKLFLFYVTTLDHLTLILSLFSLCLSFFKFVYLFYFLVVRSHLQCDTPWHAKNWNQLNICFIGRPRQS